MNHDEAEISGDAVLAQGRIGACQVYFAGLYKVFHNLPQIQAYPWFDSETYAQIHAKKRSGYQCLETVLQGVGSVYVAEIENPVMVGPFRLLVYDGVYQFVVNFIIAC